MPDAPHFRPRLAMARLALAICDSEATRSEKLRLMAQAFAPDADRIYAAGMDETILAADRRKREIKGSAK